MTKTGDVSIASKVRELADSHLVTNERDGISRLAVAITSLTGDIVELDDIEQLLVNLKRKGVLSKTEAFVFHRGYLIEKRGTKKSLDVECS